MRCRRTNTPLTAALPTRTAAVLLLASLTFVPAGCAGSRSALEDLDVTEKLDLRLRQALDPAQEGEELGGWIQVIVRLTHTASAEDQEALGEYGEVRSMVDHFVTLRLPRESVMELASLERVAHVELSIPAVPAPVPPPGADPEEGSRP